MKEKLQKLVNSKLFTMAISLAIAVGLWMVVVTTVYTESDGEVKSVPVNFTYEASGYTAKGLDIVSQPSYTVNLRVRGNRQYINSLDKDDFIVYPDYSNLNGPGEYDLPLRVKCLDSNWDSGRSEFLNDRDLPAVNVVFDTVASKSFAIATDTSSVKIAEGYIFDKAVCSPSEVTLTGPESEISKVKRIVAPLYVEGERSETLTQSATLVALDENGEELKLKYVTFSTDLADVTLSVLQRKTLELKVELINVPAGFDVTQLQERMKISPETLTVSGTSSRLEISELVVAYFDVADFVLGRSYQLPIQLPNGVRSREDVSTVSLSFDSTGLASKVLEVSDIRMTNLPENYDVKVTTDKISNVTLIGPMETLAGVRASGVIAQLRGEDFPLSEGAFTAPVNIQIPGNPNVFAVGEYTVECEVTKKEG